MSAPSGGQNFTYAGNNANNKQAQVSLIWSEIGLILTYQLGNAYQELAKELSSERLKVVGGYTLGRVIGEGAYLLWTIS